MNDKVSPMDPGLLTGAAAPTAVAAATSPTTPASTVKKAAKPAKKKAAKKTAKPAKKVTKKAAKKKRGPGRPPKKNKTNSDVFLCIFRTNKKFISRLDKLAKKKDLNRSETIRTTLTKAIEANKF